MEQQSTNPKVPSSDPFPSHDLPAEPARDPRVDAYVAQVSNELVGEVPVARRRELCREIAAHLDALVAAYEEVGTPRDEAVRRTLERFGSAGRVAREWSREWRHKPGYGQAWWVSFLALACFVVAVLHATAGWMPVALGLRLVPAFAAGLVAAVLVPSRLVRGVFYLLIPAALLSLAYASIVISVIPGGVVPLDAVDHLWRPLWRLVNHGLSRPLTGVWIAIGIYGAATGCGSRMVGQWLRRHQERRARLA